MSTFAASSSLSLLLYRWPELCSQFLHALSTVSSSMHDERGANH